MTVIEARNLSRHYRGPDGPVIALEGIDLDIAAGEFVIVQGPSGSGKTTLLLALSGLLGAGRGTVRLLGREISTLGAEERARFRAGRVGFVFQQFHLVPYLDILENVLLPTVAAPRAEARTRAESLLAELNLSGRRRHTPAELSTGEKQRAALARAFISDPAVIMADEPTGNLDEENAEIVMRRLAGYAAGGGTVILATHDFRSAVKPTRLMRLSGGRLTGPGSPPAPRPGS